MGKIFETIRGLHDAGQGVDINTVKTALIKSRVDVNQGELAEILTSVPNATHAGHYAAVVKESYFRRRLLILSDSIRQRANAESESIQEILGDIEGTISAINSGDETWIVTAFESVEATYDRLFKNATEDRTSAIKTGVPSIDAKIGGLVPGEMTVLAARPGCGKTSLAMQVAEHVAKTRPVLFASLEMGDLELTGRAIAARTGINSRDLRAGMVSHAQKTDIKKAMAEIGNLDLTFYVPPKCSLRQIRAAARLKQSQTGLDLLVIDYLGLIRPDGRSSGKYEDTTKISNDIKALARELKVPVLILAQLNREAHGQRPQLSHLRDSGAIEQDADLVWFLEPKDWEQAHKTEFNFIVAKNRHGQIGKTELMFEGNKTRFIATNYHSEFAAFETTDF